MKHIKRNIFLFAMFTVSPLTVNAQTADDADSTVVKKKVHVAFRDKDPDHLLSRSSSRRYFLCGHGRASEEGLYDE